MGAERLRASPSGLQRQNHETGKPRACRRHRGLGHKPSRRKTRPRRARGRFRGILPGRGPHRARPACSPFRPGEAGSPGLLRHAHHGTRMPGKEGRGRERLRARPPLRLFGLAGARRPGLRRGKREPCRLGRDRSVAAGGKGAVRAGGRHGAGRSGTGAGWIPTMRGVRARKRDMLMTTDSAGTGSGTARPRRPSWTAGNQSIIWNPRDDR